MNILRVWGGGVFLPDAFYDACDLNGILVYHDMQFAQQVQCTTDLSNGAKYVVIGSLWCNSRRRCWYFLRQLHRVGVCFIFSRFTAHVYNPALVTALHYV